MAKLRHMGIRDSTVGLVIPTGYSFNLDAFSIYITLAAVFIAQATNTPISMADLLTILAISLVTSKGAHGVPGSAIVVLAATLHAIPAIPAIGLVLVLSVDWFMGIARALGNLIGNCVATVAIAAWEGDIDRKRAHAVLNGTIAGRRAAGRPDARRGCCTGGATEPRHDRRAVTPSQRRSRSAWSKPSWRRSSRPASGSASRQLAETFGVSRTLVREALMQLQARGFVEVQSRRGWYVVEPSLEEARDAFSARRIIESGHPGAKPARPLSKVIRKLRKHIADEQRAIEGADAATRAFLLADFHVCLADQMGHRLLVDVLRDLTARTTLAATLVPIEARGARVLRRPRGHRRRARGGRHARGAAADARAHRQCRAGARGRGRPQAPTPHERLRATLGACAHCLAPDTFSGQALG